MTEDTSSNKIEWVILAVILLFATLIVLAIAWPKPEQETQRITNFYECQDAGGNIAESYPEQCFLDGQSFTNPDQVAEKPPAEPEEDSTDNTDTTDTDSYIGLTEAEALEKAEREQKPARVISRDGKAQPMTMDLVLGRLNFHVRDDKIEIVEVESD